MPRGMPNYLACGERDGIFIFALPNDHYLPSWFLGDPADEEMAALVLG